MCKILNDFFLYCIPASLSLLAISNDSFYALGFFKDSWPFILNPIAYMYAYYPLHYYLKALSLFTLLESFL